MSKPSVFYNFQINNSTSSTKLADQTDTRDNPILQKADDYAMSIVKFNLPASDVDSFVIDNSSDYQIQLSSGYLPSGSPPQTYTINKSTLGMKTTAVFPMKSYEDFLENLNRTSLSCYQEYLANFNTEFSNVISTTSFITIANPYTAPTSNNTITMTAPAGYTNCYLGYISLSLTFKTYTDLQPAYQDSDDLWEIWLVNPAGDKCLVAGTWKFDKTTAGKTYQFEDGAIYSITSFDNDSGISEDTAVIYQPQEPFVKFCDRTNISGNWTLRIHNKSNDPAHDFQGDLECTLTFDLLPECTTNGNQLNVIDTAPSFDINSDNKLEIIYPETLPLSGGNISFSSKLNDLLGFSSVLRNDGFYQIKQPQINISKTLKESVRYTQPITTLYKLTDISEIQIRSSNLPIEAEFDADSNSNIVMSLNTSSTDLNKSVYEFFNSNLVDRSYKLINNQEIRSLNFSVWIKYRSTGAVKQAYLPPHSTFNMLVKFINLNN